MSNTYKNGWVFTLLSIANVFSAIVFSSLYNMGLKIWFFKSNSQGVPLIPEETPFIDNVMAVVYDFLGRQNILLSIEMTMAPFILIGVLSIVVFFFKRTIAFWITLTCLLISLLLNAGLYADLSRVDFANEYADTFKMEHQDSEETQDIH